MTDPRLLAALGLKPTIHEEERRASLRSVDRAVGELRRGDGVLVRPDGGPALLALAAESVTDRALALMRDATGTAPRLMVTRQRAAALGLIKDGPGVVVFEPTDPLDAALVRQASDPAAHPGPPDQGLSGLSAMPMRALPADSDDGAAAVVRLVKLARLLPAAVAAPVARPVASERLMARLDLLSVAAYDIAEYEAHAASSLGAVAEAAVPLDGAEATRIVAFRPTDGGQEHLALVVGRPDPAAPALVRLHSECFTGDLLGSLRCDCGDQLRGAVREIARAGSGVLLYLAQEGRGIGLVNKLRAYRLQDADYDTVDANEMLGFDADERIYLPAAEMLRRLGLTRVRLLTNNPDKVAQLARCGIEVVERVTHSFPANGHNEFYLGTKRRRSGHLL